MPLSLYSLGMGYVEAAVVVQCAWRIKGEPVGIRPARHLLGPSPRYWDRLKTCEGVLARGRRGDD